MRICRLNRIKIKDPEKWDKAQYSDFVGNQFTHRKTGNKKNDNMFVEEKLLTINEEVTIYEFAPKKFQEIREMDCVDKDIIKNSLSAKRNRDQVF